MMGKGAYHGKRPNCAGSWKRSTLANDLGYQQWGSHPLNCAFVQIFQKHIQAF